jgi:hypothetical protein
VIYDRDEARVVEIGNGVLCFYPAEYKEGAMEVKITMKHTPDLPLRDEVRGPHRERLELVLRFLKPEAVDLLIRKLTEAKKTMLP